MEFIVINFQTWKVIESLGKAVCFSENKKKAKKDKKQQISQKQPLYTNMNFVRCAGKYIK